MHLSVFVVAKLASVCHKTNSERFMESGTPPENGSRSVQVYDSIQVQLMNDNYWKTVTKPPNQ